MTTLKTRFTALLTVAALALGTAAPAAAASDGQKAINTVLGLLALGAIIHELDKDGTPTRRAAPAPRYDGGAGGHGWGHDRGDRGRHGGGYDRRDDHRRDPAPVWRESRALRVPAACVISVQGRGGRSEAVSQDCLIRNRFEGRLPEACAFDIRNERGRFSSVYGANCLRDRGVRIGR